MVDTSLEFLRFRVMGIMSTMESLNEKNLQPLANVPLGRLRRNATRLHGVCRFNKGVDKRDVNLCPTDVREVALHPESLKAEWLEYAEFLMFHEFLHALGHGGHDKQFRYLEAQWPNKDAKQMGIDFAVYLRKRNAKFAWKCPTCDWQTERPVRSAGRYLCRSCKVKLIDCALTAN